MSLHSNGGCSEASECGGEERRRSTLRSPIPHTRTEEIAVHTTTATFLRMCPRALLAFVRHHVFALDRHSCGIVCLSLACTKCFWVACTRISFFRFQCVLDCGHVRARVHVLTQECVCLCTCSRALLDHPTRQPTRKHMQQQQTTKKQTNKPSTHVPRQTKQAEATTLKRGDQNKHAKAIEPASKHHGGTVGTTAFIQVMWGSVIRCFRLRRKRAQT